MTAYPAWWAMEANELKKFVVRKKYFVLGQLEQLRQDKKSLVPA
jgi:hypothetical protein